MPTVSEIDLNYRHELKKKKVELQVLRVPLNIIPERANVNRIEGPYRRKIQLQFYSRIISWV